MLNLLAHKKSFLTLLDIAQGPNRGRPRVSLLDQQRMQRLRMKGETLRSIASIMDFSELTVFKYTACIPCHRRQNKYIRIHRRTGLAA